MRWLLQPSPALSVTCRMTCTCIPCGCFGERDNSLESHRSFCRGTGSMGIFRNLVMGSWWEMPPKHWFKTLSRAVRDCPQLWSPWGRAKGTCSSLPKHSEKSFPSLTSRNKARAALGAPGRSMPGPASELQVLTSRMLLLQMPPSPTWPSGKSLTRLLQLASSASIFAEGELSFPSSLPAMPSRKTKRHC